jgi:hypothetical protein
MTRHRFHLFGPAKRTTPHVEPSSHFMYPAPSPQRPPFLANIVPYCMPFEPAVSLVSYSQPQSGVAYDGPQWAAHLAWRTCSRQQRQIHHSPAASRFCTSMRPLLRSPIRPPTCLFSATGPRASINVKISLPRPSPRGSPPAPALVLLLLVLLLLVLLLLYCRCACRFAFLTLVSVPFLSPFNCRFRLVLDRLLRMRSHGEHAHHNDSNPHACDPSSLVHRGSGSHRRRAGCAC